MRYFENDLGTTEDYIYSSGSKIAIDFNVNKFIISTLALLANLGFFPFTLKSFNWWEIALQCFIGFYYTMTDLLLDKINFPLQILQTTSALIHLTNRFKFQL